MCIRDRSNGAVLKMPTAVGSAGHVLENNGAGVLSWAAQSAGAITAKKFWLTPTGTVPAGQMVGTVNNVNWSHYGAANDKQMDWSHIVAEADEPKVVDVYVNGQLMVSGSDAERNGGTADYHAINQAGIDRANVDLKFAFDIEADDTISVIARS